MDWTLDDWFIHRDEVAQIGENGALRRSMKHVRAVLIIKGTPGPQSKRDALLEDRSSCVPGQRVAKATEIFGLGTDE